MTLTRNIFNFGYNTGCLARNILSTVDLRDKEALSFREICRNVAGFPVRYKRWWVKLLEDDPLHVFIETLLLVFAVYILVLKKFRKKDSSFNIELTSQEKDDLIREWKPAPLTPPSTTTSNTLKQSIVVKKIHGVKTILENDSEVINFGSNDFLGLSTEVKEVSKNTLKKYGCGSCGPRGFYGTVDVHLELEKKIASFCHSDAAILYSDAASTVTSAVTAFAKRGDLLVVDEGIYEPLFTGVTLSRANVKFFKHNDMDDLRRVLEHVRMNDRKIGRKLSDQRRYIVIEGIYHNYGDVVPLDIIVKLKHEFKYRIILDESISFGTLGKTGRGVIELFQKKISQDIEIVTISLENSLASIGGVCIGSNQIVDHQRLSGPGYCFSASSPPFLASAAMQSLKLLPSYLDQLSANRSLLFQFLKDKIQPWFTIKSSELCTILFLHLHSKYSPQSELLEIIAKKCLQQGILIIASTHHPTGLTKIVPSPSIRVHITAAHTLEHIELFVQVFLKVVKEILN